MDEETSLELMNALQGMIDAYWGEGDGIEPPPVCIQKAEAALAKAREYTD